MAESLTPESNRAIRLLVIDDEAAIGRTLAITLADEFDVHTATSGPEGLAILARDPRFDVILCDLRMPNMAGIDVFRVAVERQRELGPRFVFTTGGDFAEPTCSLDDVAVPIVEKPFSLDHLRQVLWDRAEATRAMPAVQSSG
jgi:DNA-binding NtrC family response regulator